MTTRWRIFISGDRKFALGMKAERDEELWIPEIVAISNPPSDFMRLDRVTILQERQLKIDDGRATLNVHYVRCVLPLTLEDQMANAGGRVLAEDQELRALPRYGKRGTWYKIAPR